MTDVELKQFLDTGWFSEATLYYHGYVYWCEGYWEQSEFSLMNFNVYRFPVKIVNKKYFSRTNYDETGVYEIVYNDCGENEDRVKESFLVAKIFEGKSFWEAEKDIAWYDESI